MRQGKAGGWRRDGGGWNEDKAKKRSQRDVDERCGRGKRTTGGPVEVGDDGDLLDHVCCGGERGRGGEDGEEEEEGRDVRSKRESDEGGQRGRTRAREGRAAHQIVVEVGLSVVAELEGRPFRSLPFLPLLPTHTHIQHT
jgi:hypothetical protein